MPTASGSIIYGQVNVTNGSTAVTGLNTAFTSQLTAGSSYLVFGNDPTKTQYLVSTVTDNNNIVLGSSYAGATATTTARLITRLSGTSVAISTAGAVTGVGTSFSTQLSVGQWITVSGDTNTGAATGYQIATISSNTAATVLTRSDDRSCGRQCHGQQLHQPGAARVRHCPGAAADRHSRRGPERRRCQLHRPARHPLASHGQLRPHLPGAVRHGRLRLCPGRHPPRFRRDHQLLSSC